MLWLQHSLTVATVFTSSDMSKKPTTPTKGDSKTSCRPTSGIGGYISPGRRIDYQEKLLKQIKRLLDRN